MTTVAVSARHRNMPDMLISSARLMTYGITDYDMNYEPKAAVTRSTCSFLDHTLL